MHGRICNEASVVRGTPGLSQPLVSVVTASFDALDGLRATVDSVARQADVACEHIVVDGGSRDGTRAYLEALGGSVRWLSEPDRGIADALNKGVAMARGEYVIVLQAEDTFTDPHSLARAAPRLDGTTDIVSYDVEVVGEGWRQTMRSRGFGPAIEFFSAFSHQGAFCRRSLFERLGGFDASLAIAMDYDFMLRAKRAGASLRTVPETIALVPATGISSRVDEASLRRRLDENRRVQRRYLRGPIHRFVNEVFWRLYARFKLMKHRRARP